jgi:excisionase family DNA binding protein
MTKRFLSPLEAGEYLGIKPKTIYSLAARGRIPAVRFGRQLRIDLRRLEAQVDAELSKTLEESHHENKTSA